MSEAIQTILASTLATVIIVMVGYFGRLVIETSRTLAAHLSADEEQFDALNERVTDLKNEQRDQTSKLDRLVDHLLQ